LNKYKENGDASGPTPHRRFDSIIGHADSRHNLQPAE
jgi:hypothetical protein